MQPKTVFEAFREHGFVEIWPERPFLVGYVCKLVAELPTGLIFRRPLPQKTMGRIGDIIGGPVTLPRLGAFLRSRCNVHDLASLTWEDIIEVLKLQEGGPTDLMPLHKVVEEYNVSRATLQRHIKAGVIRSYRKKDTEQHLLSRSEVKDRYTRRP